MVLRKYILYILLRSMNPQITYMKKLSKCISIFMAGVVQQEFRHMTKLCLKAAMKTDEWFAVNIYFYNDFNAFVLPKPSGSFCFYKKIAPALTYCQMLSEIVHSIIVYTNGSATKLRRRRLETPTRSLSVISYLGRVRLWNEKVLFYYLHSQR